MADPFTILVGNLKQLGFFGFFLPFLLMFAISYGLLLKNKVLGENPKIIGVVSLLLAFFVIGFGGPLLGAFFINLFGLAVVILGGILVIVLFIGMTGGSIASITENKIVTAVVVGIGILLFVAVVEGVTRARLISNEFIATILVIIIMGISVMFIAGGK